MSDKERPSAMYLGQTGGELLKVTRIEGISNAAVYHT